MADDTRSRHHSVLGLRLGLMAIGLGFLGMGLMVLSYTFNPTALYPLAQACVDAGSSSDGTAVLRVLRGLIGWMRGLNQLSSLLYQSCVGLVSLALIPSAGSAKLRAHPPYPFGPSAVHICEGPCHHIKEGRKDEMRAKQFLFIAVVAAMLGAMIAFPVMAEDETSMWVSRVRLAYNGRSSNSPDRVVGMVHVRDANMSAVAGALVAATWTKPDGTTLETTAVADFQGIATFQVWAGSGEYQLCVTDVTLDGWLYDPDANAETCGVLVIQWPFNPPG